MKVLANIGKVPSQPWESRVVVAIDLRDMWIGWYRSSDYHYICLLPLLVIRLDRGR